MLLPTCTSCTRLHTDIFLYVYTYTYLLKSVVEGLTSMLAELHQRACLLAYDRFLMPARRNHDVDTHCNLWKKGGGRSVEWFTRCGRRGEGRSVEWFTRTTETQTRCERYERGI
jgi:hypothetical protein